jgi:N utilization substance protein B
MQKKNTPTTRRKARNLALQAIYQWQLTQASTLEIQSQFLENPLMDQADSAYFLELLQCIVKTVAVLDEHIQPVLDRRINELNPVELAIVRIGAYELAQRPEIPYRVVINEALRLAKTFGATEGFRYVNAVLDKLAHKLRATEIASLKR